MVAMGMPRPVWSMLYHEAFNAPAADLEILNTSRRLTCGFWPAAGMCSVPCQVPTISFDEVVGEAACDAGAVEPGADGVACAFAGVPFPARAKAIVTAMQEISPSNVFPRK
jgi:hypothetical protein